MESAIEQTARRVSELARDALFYQEDERELENIKSAFGKLEAIGAPALEAVTLALRNDWQVRSFLTAVGEPALKYLEYALLNGDAEAQKAVTEVLGNIGDPALEMLSVLYSSGYFDQVIWVLFGWGVDLRLLAKALEFSGRMKACVLEKLSNLEEDELDLELTVDTIIDELVIRNSERRVEDFNPDTVAEALNIIIKHSPKLHGRVLRRLCDLALHQGRGVRDRSVIVAKRLSEDEFMALVKERAKENPLAARAILQLLGVGIDVQQIVNQLSETDPADIQGIAATQIRLLQKYYDGVLVQANTSFRWAIIAAVAGLICLGTTLAFLLTTQSQNAITILTSLGSVLAQFISGTQFYLYAQTIKQRAYFHQQLNQTQRFLLANSVCESLEGENRQQARAELVKLIATFEVEPVELSDEVGSGLSPV